MNSIWINNISNYKNSRNAVLSAKVIIGLKIKRREILLKRYKINFPPKYGDKQKNLQQILLYEARAAKYFWRKFSLLLPKWCGFSSRKAKSSDIINKLLDLGYHHITNAVKIILEKYDISPSLGILHSAHKKNSAPLAYDLVEMFRADIVDLEVLKFLRSKKKPMVLIRQKDIGIFLSRINSKLEKKYYLKGFKQCRSYRYYMELQILKFVKAVNHKEIFHPLSLPIRHDIRCKSSDKAVSNHLTI